MKNINLTVLLNGPIEKFLAALCVCDIKLVVFYPFIAVSHLAQIYSNNLSTFCLINIPIWII